MSICINSNHFKLSISTSQGSAVHFVFLQPVQDAIGLWAKDQDVSHERWACEEALGPCKYPLKLALASYTSSLSNMRVARSTLVVPPAFKGEPVA